MGFMELLLVFLVVLLFFGASRLPAIGEGLGKAVRGFKEAVRPEPPAGGAPRKDLPPPDALPRGPDEPAR